MREVVAPVLTNPPAAAHGVVERKGLNVSNLTTISPIEDRSPTLVLDGASQTTEKKAENEAK
jgi:hypothetical protein